mgnify:CR=1 FL=1
MINTKDLIQPCRDRMRATKSHVYTKWYKRVRFCQAHQGEDPATFTKQDRRYLNFILQDLEPIDEQEV